MPLNESQVRVVNEELRVLSESIRGLVARYQTMAARWQANDMDNIADDDVVTRPDSPPLVGAELKAIKTAFDGLNTAATSDPQATALINKACVQPLSLG